MKSAGEPVASLGELPAGVEPGEDELDAGDAFLGVDVDGHPAPVVDDRQRVVGVEDDDETGRLSDDGLIHAVVHDLLREMVRARGVGIHARTLAHGVEPGQDLDRGGVVDRAHGRTGFRFR